MRRPVFLLFLFFIFWQGCAPALKQDSSYISLWEAKGLSNTVWLLGSIHVGREDMYPLPQPMLQALADSPVLVVELNISSVNSSDMMKQASYPLGQNLKQDLPPKLYQEVINQSRKYHLPELMIRRFRPWMVALLLESLSLTSMGLDPQLGIDYYFLNLAEDKRIIELETLDEQMNVFQTLSLEEQIAYLSSTLRQDKLRRKILDIMVRAWIEGDTQTVSRLYSPRNMKANPQLYQNLLDNRNQNMSVKIEEFLRQGENHLVIVGLAHYSGPDSIIAILQTRGWDIRQVSYQP